MPQNGPVSTASHVRTPSRRGPVFLFRGAAQASTIEHRGWPSLFLEANPRPPSIRWQELDPGGFEGSAQGGDSIGRGRDSGLPFRTLHSRHRQPRSLRYLPLRPSNESARGAKLIACHSLLIPSDRCVY